VHLMGKSSEVVQPLVPITKMVPEDMEHVDTWKKARPGASDSHL
jgi:hypothetical protein